MTAETQETGRTSADGEQASPVPAFRCSAAARDREDPFFATAPPARRWLLVEHPGPWGPAALTGAGFDDALVAAIDAVCARDGYRFQLIRRTAARGAPTEARGRFAVVDTAAGRETVRWGRVDDPSGLPAALDDLDATTTVDDEPLYLVCTHGRHDACCAMRGRPVAAVLSALHPGRTWETTHTGGDRFAANAILMPHGIVLGQVPATDAPAIAAAYDEGRVPRHHVRGRAGLAPFVQGAQHHARLQLDEDGVDALAPLGSERVDDTTWSVRLDGGDRGVVTVVVRERWMPSPTPLTCGAGRASSMRTYDLVDLAVEPAVGAGADRPAD